MDVRTQCLHIRVLQEACGAERDGGSQPGIQTTHEAHGVQRVDPQIHERGTLSTRIPFPGLGITQLVHDSDDQGLALGE